MSNVNRQFQNHQSYQNSKCGSNPSIKNYSSSNGDGGSLAVLIWVVGLILLIVMLAIGG